MSSIEIKINSSSAPERKFVPTLVNKGEGGVVDSERTCAVRNIRRFVGSLRLHLKVGCGIRVQAERHAIASFMSLS